jgi:hypothetical protein
MTARIIGPTGSKRRRRLLFGTALVIALLTLSFIGGAQGIHAPPDTSFELDKNALDDTSTTLDDWENLYDGTDHASATSTDPDSGNPIIDDPFGTTIFTGGGSKDDLEISSWQHKSGSVPPKDEITDAYAAVYQVGSELRLYFGADRFANNGAAQIGFWFFQNAITLNTNGTFNGVHNAGTVPHSASDPGDLLILSDFTVGGSISTIRVFEWVGSGGSDGAVNLIASGVDCASSNSVHGATNPEFCGEVNSGNETAPWPYEPKFGTSGTFPPGSFYEAGIDLSAFGFQNLCLNSFLAETRSSPSVDATLKDFVLGSFPTCQANIVTTPSSLNVTPGEQVRDEATITGSGLSAPAPKGTVNFFLCAKDVSPCASNGTPVGTVDLSTNTSNPVTVFSDYVNTAASPLAPGTYCFAATWTNDPTYDDDSDRTTGECFTVSAIPTAITTAQFWFPNDSATVTTTGPAGYNLTGSVKFSLYSNSSCTGTALYEETRSIPANEGLDATVKTTNGDGVGTGLAADFPVNINNDGTYSWLVVYTPNETPAVHTGSTRECHDEHSDLTIVDDDPNIPPPS